MFMRVLRVVIALAAVLAIGYYAGVFSERSRMGTNVKPAGEASPIVQSHGEADIGGAFTLTSTAGAAVTEQDLLGRHALVYFGYTNCPDVCPVDMNRISLALEALPETVSWRDRLQPVFVSVDAARDTPEVVAAFLTSYHPAFIGLTGTPEQIAQAAGAYKVAYEEMLDDEHNHTGLITHSSYIYLMGPDGRYITHFGPDATASEIAARLAGEIG